MQSGKRVLKTHKNDQQRLALLLQQMTYIYTMLTKCNRMKNIQLSKTENITEKRITVKNKKVLLGNEINEF